MLSYLHVIGSLVLNLPETRQVAQPSLLYGASDGSIGCILSISAEHYKILEALQSSLADKIRSAVGGFNHTE